MSQTLLLITLFIIGLISTCVRTEQRALVALRSANAWDLASDLDIALQKAATDALGGREGAVLVIDPQSGRLHAVVNQRVAFEQTYPPGSAIKPFTALAALRAGMLNRGTTHQCAMRYEREDFEILCSHSKSSTPFDLVNALAYSCNDYFAHVGERLSDGVFDATLAAFGFGARTGVRARESQGILPRGKWRVREALGESGRLLVTPIQMIRAYTALATGGRLYRPQLPQARNDVASRASQLNIQPEHRAVLLEGMRGVVKYGTAKKSGLGSLPYYIFGKTGTSTASNGFRTQGWFIGFAAETPETRIPTPNQLKLGVLVFLRRAHGAECAAVARSIFECSLRPTSCWVPATGNRNKH